MRLILFLKSGKMQCIYADQVYLSSEKVRYTMSSCPTTWIEIDRSLVREWITYGW